MWRMCRMTAQQLPLDTVDLPRQGTSRVPHGRQSFAKNRTCQAERELACFRCWSRTSTTADDETAVRIAPDRRLTTTRALIIDVMEAHRVAFLHGVADGRPWGGARLPYVGRGAALRPDGRAPPGNALTGKSESARARAQARRPARAPDHSPRPAHPVRGAVPRRRPAGIRPTHGCARAHEPGRS
jgi:hypothetical protein